MKDWRFQVHVGVRTVIYIEDYNNIRRSPLDFRYDLIWHSPVYKDEPFSATIAFKKLSSLSSQKLVTFTKDLFNEVFVHHLYSKLHSNLPVSQDVILSETFPAKVGGTSPLWSTVVAEPGTWADADSIESVSERQHVDCLVGIDSAVTLQRPTSAEWRGWWRFQRTKPTESVWLLTHAGKAT